MVLGLALLGSAWVFANPPGAAPDEPATYTKAMGTALGELNPTPARPAPKGVRGAVLFNAISFGSFSLPGRLAPDPRWGCTNRFPDQAATCLTRPKTSSHRPARDTGRVTAASYVAFYPPVSFFLLGIGARAAPSALDALYAGRSASLLICLILLAFALWAARGRWALAGVLAAASPMAIFLAATFNPSGVETAAGLGLGAAVVALARGDASRLVWWGFLVSGVLAATSRPVGFTWVVVDLVLLLILAGRRGVGQVLRSRPFLGGVALGVVLVAAASTVAWDVTTGHSPHANGSEFWSALGSSGHQLSTIFNQMVGNFGWVDSPMPHLAVILALSAYAALGLVALLLSSWRSRFGLLFVAAAAVLVAFVLDAGAQIPFGFGVEARYLMPLSGAALFVAGSGLDGRAERGRRARHRTLGRAWWQRLIAGLLCAGLVALQFIGWFWNSHLSAVGTRGTWSFTDHARWLPPGGWLAWLVVAGTGTVLLGLGAFGAALAGPGPTAEAETETALPETVALPG
jgi:hypothetical protein